MAIGARQPAHLNAAKGQLPQVGGYETGGMQVSKPPIRGTGDGLKAARRGRSTGQLRDRGRRTKFRSSRRAGFLG